MKEPVHKYFFDYDEITSCSDCPLFYDMYTCLLEEDEREYEDYTSWDDRIRPDFCKLSEVIE